MIRAHIGSSAGLSVSDRTVNIKDIGRMSVSDTATHLVSQLEGLARAAMRVETLRIFETEHG